MTIFEMTPVIRFSAEFIFRPRKSTITSLDHRLFYILDGKGSVTVDGTTHDFHKNSLLLWQAGSAYQFKMYGGVRVLCFNFDYDTLRQSELLPFATARVDTTQSARDLCKSCRTQFTDFAALNEPIILHNATYLLDTLKEIEEKRRTGGILCEEEASVLFKKLIILILKALAAMNEPPEISDKLESVTAYIREHYREPLSNEAIARIVGYHPYYLNRIFKKMRGITLHRYLINCRLTEAETLLVTTKMPIAEIAEHCGFSSTAAMGLDFKIKHGIKPSDYRKLHNVISPAEKF